MRKIQLKYDCYAKGVKYLAGQIVEVDGWLYQHLVKLRCCATDYVEPVAVEPVVVEKEPEPDAKEPDPIAPVLETADAAREVEKADNPPAKSRKSRR